MSRNFTQSTHFRGCLLGLALGDAFGAPYEGGWLERRLWSAIGRTAQGARRWTDDTQMSIDLANSLLACGRVEPDDLARRFAASYRWSRGYGPSTARLLKQIRCGASWQQASHAVYPDGSYGNGGAMRAPVLALFCASAPVGLAAAVQLATRVTHAHPLGIEGAVLVATATIRTLHGESPAQLLDAVAAQATLEPYIQRMGIVVGWLVATHQPEPCEIRQRLGNGIAAVDSSVTAIYLALRFAEQPFIDLLAFTARLGGDVDTIGSMAGAIWGARRGVEALPGDRLAQLERQQDIRDLADALYDRASSD